MATQNRKDTWHFNRRLQHRLKRDILLRVAAECFNARGISGTSLKDVAKMLGITDAAIYYYVKNKEELVFLCYMRALDIGTESLARALVEGETYLEKLELYIRYQVISVCGDDGPVAILSEIPSLTAEHQKEVLTRSTEHTKAITALIEGGVKAGEMAVDNPKLACNAVLGALNWLPKWYRPGGLYDADEVARSYVATLASGLVRHTV